MVSEIKVQMLMKLLESKRISTEDIKATDYKQEVEKRVNEKKRRGNRS